MKTIILLNFCDGMYGGIESFLLNAFYCLDTNQYAVRFLTCGRSTYDMFKSDIIKHHGSVDEIPILSNTYKKKLQVFYELIKYFRCYTPDIVHINSGTLSLQLLAAIAAKKCGVHKVIVHSHNFLPNKTGVKEIIKAPFKELLLSLGDTFLACSSGAAYWMFPKRMVENGTVIIIPNGVDTKKFKYDKNKRDAFRNSLNLSEELLIGNIGRFQGQKNHPFMIEIMDEVLKYEPSAKLLLVGEGELKESIISKTKLLGIDSSVLFLGERSDMDYFLSALDVFILPSLYEGLPIASVEAQASGVKTLLSSNITKEANVSGSAVFLPIDEVDSASIWAREILKDHSSMDRLIENNKVYQAGFDIHFCYQRMIDLYGEESHNDNNR